MKTMLGSMMLAVLALNVCAQTNDYGDAPAPFPTRAADNGARHNATGPILGVLRDAEWDGGPTVGADWDDTTGSDDEDGVIVIPERVGALDMQAAYYVSSAPSGAFLTCWIDFNGDGCWGGPWEQARRRPVDSGGGSAWFDVPSWAVAGPRAARFRLRTAGYLSPRGLAADGEVEDYMVEVQPPAPGACAFGGPRSISALAQGARCVFAADMDRDGDMDVISASFDDDTIAWYENNGSQTFVRHVIDNSADGARSVFAADMDGDGDLDVIAASWNSDRISLYTNDGHQIFTRDDLAWTGGDGQASCVSAADLDGDGDLDVLTSYYASDYIGWCRNLGGGNYDLPGISDLPNGPMSVTAADMDRDGDMDVLCASADDNMVAWYENNGIWNPSFNRRIISAVAGGATCVVAADVDRDGDMDAVSADYDANAVAWYENDGSQVFTRHIVSANRLGARSVFAADMDGDGDVDILSASESDHIIVCYRNDGSQHFTARGISLTAFGARSVFAADMDQDGDLDVLSASDLNNLIAWYEQIPPSPDIEVYGGGEHIFDGDSTPRAEDGTHFGTNSWARTFSIRNEGTADLEVDAVALSGAQAADFRIVSAALPASLSPGASVSFTVRFFPGVSAVSDARVLIAHDDPVNNPYDFLIRAAVSTADHDLGDAPAPYATTRAEQGALHFIGGPRLGARPDADIDGVHSALADADDLANRDDEDAVIARDLRAGLQAAKVSVIVSNAPAGALLDAWIDFNGDGCWGGPGEQIARNVSVADGGNLLRQDIPSWVLAGTCVGRFRLSTAGGLGPAGVSLDGEVEDHAIAIDPGAQGSGLFAAHTLSTAVDGARCVVTADVDRDGFVDVLSSSANDDRIRWFRNNGSGGFEGAHDVSTTADGAECVVTADMDGDGDPDVLSASANDNTIAWYETEPTWKFPEHTIATNAAGAKSVFVADVDGDGAPDVLLASENDDTIAWYENNGSQGFTKRTIATDADMAFSVFAADVDGDSDLDVLSASRNDDTIAWYENDGRQNFTAHTISTSADGAVSVAAADLDGDGDLDVLSASYGDNTIAWYENDGNESFTKRTISAAAGQAWHVAAADLDSDGDLDVVSALKSADTVAWYENNGSGSFTAHTAATTADDVRCVAAADVDGDGDLDLLSASAVDDKVAWYEQTAPQLRVRGNGLVVYDGDNTPQLADHTDFGTNNQARTYTIANTGSVSLPVDTITLSGIDAAWFYVSGITLPVIFPAGASHTFTVWILPGLGEVRTARVEIRYNGLTEYPYDFAIRAALATDVGDAPAPYPVPLADNGPVHVAIGPLLGSLRDADTTDANSAGADADDVTGSDDEDGVAPGWIRVGAAAGRVTLTVNGAPMGAKLDAWVDLNADGCWKGPWEQVAYGKTVSNGANALSFHVPSWAKAGDACARFRLSLAGGLRPWGAAADGEVEDHLLLLRPPAPGSRAFSTAKAISGVADGASSVFAADVDGDGDMDVLSASSNDDKIAWYENDGSQRFALRTITTGANGAECVFAVDMDGDGDTDVLSASYIDDTIAWYKQDNKGGFSVYNVSTNVDGARCVYAGDMDGDGDMDVLSAAELGDRITWHLNDGAGSFLLVRTVSSTADGARWACAADMDGDGDLDAVSASYVSDQVAWHERSGASFTTHPIYTGANGAACVAAADMDGDGDMDVLSASYLDATVAWYENDGAMGFTRHAIDTTATGASSVSAADLDGDGDLDVLSASWSADTVTWYENNGSDTFAAHAISTAADGARSVYAADVDGDGDLDVLAASTVDDSIRWFEQTKIALTAEAGPHGGIVPSGTVFVARGGSTNFTMTPAAYYHIGGVTTNGATVGAVGSFTWSNVRGAGTIRAEFAANLAAMGTPHWWLAYYGWTSGFDAAEGSNPDGDPHLTWQEYIADTIPTDGTSYLRITGLSDGPPLSVHFESSSNRLYSLIDCNDLVSGAWSNAPGAGPRVGVGGPDWMQDTNPSAHFYRIGVELP